MGWIELKDFGQSLVVDDALPDPAAIPVGQTPVSFTLHHDSLANRRQFGLPVFVLGFRSFRHTLIVSKAGRNGYTDFVQLETSFAKAFARDQETIPLPGFLVGRFEIRKPILGLECD